ncbi:hypothetical protein NDU88_007896 [Pleurodeles waltl]|uniref:Uncharacterized protein n=1 Tax=Pleurodeles waltl TaxID=8319 RepID=A0AAV7PSS5_PLEWA|nr:hypothetical protein NDU88_007896 [Pleurodeles waltl]
MIGPQECAGPIPPQHCPDPGHLIHLLRTALSTAGLLPLVRAALSRGQEPSQGAAVGVSLSPTARGLSPLCWISHTVLQAPVCTPSVQASPKCPRPTPGHLLDITGVVAWCAMSEADKQAGVEQRFTRLLLPPSWACPPVPSVD